MPHARINKLASKPVIFVSALALLAAPAIACGGSSATPEAIGTVVPAVTIVATVEAQAAAAAMATEPAPAEAAPTEAPPAAATEASTPQGPQTFKIGDIVKIGDNVLIVLGWSELAGDDFNKPDAGKKFIAADVLLVNAGAEASNLSTFLQLSLKDDTAQSYNQDISATTASKRELAGGELAPGERTRGSIGFQIPVEAKGLQLVFDNSIFGTGKVFVDLGEQPTSIEAPAQVDGETAQPTAQIGETVKAGTLAITVNEVKDLPASDFNKPDPGHKFLLVDVTLDNNDSAAARVSSYLQMSLKDATGQYHKLDIGAITAAGGKTPDGELAPGEKLRGQVAFEIPESANGLVFVFDPDLASTGKVNVALP